MNFLIIYFFFQAEDGIRDGHVTGVQTCALPIWVIVADGSVLHVTHVSDYNPKGFPLTVGDDVTVGHGVTLHGCTLGNRILVGVGSIVLDGAVVEDEVMIGAGSLVAPGKRLESGYLYLGSPCRRARALTDSEREFFRYSSANYVKLKSTYLDEFA